DLRPILDEELERLPEKFRAPLVLCYLQGKTNEQAARELDCPAGSMSWRLVRGKELLRRRLERRGLALSAVALAAILAGGAAPAAVASTLVAVTVRSAVRFVEFTAVSGPAATLAEGVPTEMSPATWKTTIVAVVLATAVTGGVSLAGWKLLAPPAPT